MHLSELLSSGVEFPGILGAGVYISSLCTMFYVHYLTVYTCQECMASIHRVYHFQLNLL